MINSMSYSVAMHQVVSSNINSRTTSKLWYKVSKYITVVPTNSSTQVVSSRLVSISGKLYSIWLEKCDHRRQLQFSSRCLWPPHICVSAVQFCNWYWAVQCDTPRVTVRLTIYWDNWSLVLEDTLKSRTRLHLRHFAPGGTTYFNKSPRCLLSARQRSATYCSILWTMLWHSMFWQFTKNYFSRACLRHVRTATLVFSEYHWTSWWVATHMEESHI